ncbi:MAG: hypothetical protein HYY17_06525 [Planctomycetes bacterium]|nr:hypothetical protein [Planctomycetota bacterium]
MSLGHLYVRAAQEAVIDSMDRHFAAKGFARIEMNAGRHPRAMKRFHENQLRLFWVAPRLGEWTGIFEFRYYSNEVRERWGYADEHLATALSRELGAVYRFEVMDTAGFWMYVRYDRGEETASRVHEDRPLERSADPAHPRYELNRLIEREGIRNAGLGYENIPGPMVAPVEGCRWWPPEAVEGLEGFVHRAYELHGDREIGR